MRGRSEYPYRNACGKCGARRIDQQLGLEPTPEAYITAMVAVFREVRRVLRPDGTLWLNIGSSYAGSGVHTSEHANPGLSKAGEREGQSMERPVVVPGFKPKDLVPIPWMLAMALQADGWYLRSDIIWSKPNPMPESVTDRPTKAHEYIFLLTKSARYYYDADAIREAHGGELHAPGNKGSYSAEMSTNTRPDRMDAVWGNPAGRNKRSVWEIATEPYAAAHFATYPQALVEPCIKAGTSERGVCPECGAPWVRVVERTGHINTREPAHQPGNTPTKVDSTGWAPTTVATDRWAPTCTHGAEPVPGTVLDPFLGSGTTAWVATRLGRRAIGIDLNADYLDLAVERNRQQGLL